MANNVNVKKLEADLWESADLLRAGSKLTSNQYCMPVLGLIFLRYAYSRFKLVEQEILKDRPVRGGRQHPGAGADRHRGQSSDQFGRSGEQRHGTGGAAERAAAGRSAEGLHHLLG